MPASQIKKESLVKDIILLDYRTSAVFEKFGIGYCCGPNWSLDAVCQMKGIAWQQFEEELNKATRSLQVHHRTPFEEWSIDFLTDYIINVHHHYLKHTLPELWPVLNKFTDEHVAKDPRLFQVQVLFRKLQKNFPPHLKEEEEVVFPYICQLAHAYADKDPYGGLLVKTLRKPIIKMMETEHEAVKEILNGLREHTNNYTPPEKSCSSHRVVFARLKELDHDLAQHMYLENGILFPRALAMEKELLR